MKKNTFLFKTSLLIIFGGGVHQIPYIRYCKKNKISTLVIDQNINCPAKLYADYLLNIPTPNKKSLSVFKAIKKITQKSKVLGVLVAGIELAILGSFIAKKFKTKSITSLVAKNATNKINRTIKFKKKNVPYANYEIINNLKSLKKNYPYVIKTEEGSGARGVRVISSKSDLEAAKRDFSLVNTSKYLVEEFLKGFEISIEAFIYNGKFNYYCFAIRDIEIISNGKIIEHGSVADPQFDKQKLKQIKRVFEKACAAIGLNEGPAKGDIMFTYSGPKVIEVASRSAPLAPLISKKVFGFDMISTHVKWSMGLKLKFDSKLLDFSKSRPVCHKYLLHKKGVIYNINGIEKVKKLKNVIKIVILKDLIYPLKLEEPTNTNRILYVVTTGSNAEEAKKNADTSLSNIKLLYK
jgi:biotin carboxylase